MTSKSNAIFSDGKLTCHICGESSEEFVLPMELSAAGEMMIEFAKKHENCKESKDAMKIFTYTYSGVIHGGVIIVMAPNEKKASQCVYDKLTHWDFKLLEELEINETKVIFNDDGDY